MKKIMSMLLVLCMVCTALVGTMIVDVNASYSNATNEDSTLTHTHTFDATITKGFDVGEWYLSNGTKSVKLGDVSDDYSNFGMTFKSYDFKSGTLNDITGTGSLIFRNEVHNGVGDSKYLSKDASYSQADNGGEYFTIATLDTEVTTTSTNYNNGIYGKAVKYTAYAYSELETGLDVTFNFTRTNSDLFSVTVPVSALYSANSVPHKVELVYYYNYYASKPVSSAIENHNYISLYIDGIYFGKHTASTTKITKTNNYTFLSSNISLSQVDGSLSWDDTKLHICVPPRTSATNGTYATLHNREEFTELMFQNISDKMEAGTLRSGFINGLNNDVASVVEEAYATDAKGDRVVRLSSSYYNNPASIFNGEETNVSIVDRNGNVYDANSTFTGDFSNYYLVVNGVYAVVVVEELPITYDIATNTAVVKVSALPAGTDKFQIIVASYNDNDSLKSIKVSEQKTATAGAAISYTADDLEAGAKYRVFVFDSITTAVPLIDSLVVESN